MFVAHIRSSDGKEQSVAEHAWAEHWGQIVSSLSTQLTRAYKQGFGWYRLVQFAETFPWVEIVVSLLRQLRCSHFIEILLPKQLLERECYAQMCIFTCWQSGILSKCQEPARAKC